MGEGTWPTSRECCVYIKISDAEGVDELGVRFIHVATGDVLATGRGEFILKDRLIAHDWYMEFPPVPIPELILVQETL